MTIAVMDTETSGAIPVDSPIEISVLIVNNDGTQKVHTYEMSPEFPITSGASAIHGVLQAEAITRESHDEVLTRFYNDLSEPMSDSDTVVMGWNVDFDVKIVNQALARHEMPSIKFANVVDLMTIAKRLVGVHECGGFSLDAIFVYLNNTREGLDRLKSMRASHSAENDVKITFEVYEGLLKLATEAGYLATNNVNVSDIGSFLTYAESSNLLSEWPIGKHKGKRFADVMLKDKPYVAWVRRQDWYNEPRYSDFRYTIDTMSKRCGVEDSTPF